MILSLFLYRFIWWTGLGRLERPRAVSRPAHPHFDCDVCVCLTDTDCTLTATLMSTRAIFARASLIALHTRLVYLCSSQIVHSGADFQRLPECEFGWNWRGVAHHVGCPSSEACVEVCIQSQSESVRCAFVAWRTVHAAVRAEHVLCESQSWRRIDS